MKAAVYRQYGGPENVRVETISAPTPGLDEILIETKSTTVNSGDARIRALRVPAGFGIMVRLFFGILRPRRRVLGSAAAGTVAALGANVRNFQVGDPVVGSMESFTGAHAEFCLAKADQSALIPEGVSFEQASAIIFGGHTALYFLKDLGKLQPGQKILVNGASGSVGCALVQLASFMGAEVTAVCSAKNEALVRDLGADHVIDYHHQDFAEQKNRYDIIADCVGNAPWKRCKESLTATSRHLMVVSSLMEMIQAGFVSKKTGRQSLGGSSSPKTEELAELLKLLKDGEMKAPIDSRFSLDQIAEAHARVDTERKTGSVVINF